MLEWEVQIHVSMLDHTGNPQATESKIILKNKSKFSQKAQQGGVNVSLSLGREISQGTHFCH